MEAILYVLAYRSNDRVKRLLSSPGLGGIDVIVVDNDPGGDKPITEGPVILQGPGGGFTPGFNFALRHFMDNYNDGNYVPIILNDDLELEDGFIDAMIKPIAEENVGIVAPMQVQMDNPAMVICGGFGAAYPSGQHKAGLRGDSSIKREFSRWVTFCAVAINPAVVKEIGYLDNWMKMYYSDSDYCMRAYDAGFKLLFEPAAVVRHENHGASVEFLKERLSTRKLIMDKWYFDNKWGERVKTHLS